MSGYLKQIFRGTCSTANPTKMLTETPIYWLFILALPIACVTWTVTHEEVFREPREFCVKRSKECRSLWQRKFFYLFTCEYCFSHYITIAFLLFTGYKVFLDDWRGYILAGFALVWIANIYMSLYNIIRIDLKKGKIIARKEEESISPDRPDDHPQ